ncbi:hypothetical protein EMIHUDRAFT_449214 [Emiliania huxleyi CCMP1516]|uniref:EamA domain-containing protein n=2 Tax=Emiliania huxleyi TaxID=2903 RepID=A0A0D3KI40_EMIH1|nr:hypothetical protein EMIHUDRAFT_449214 [Emiliania huxleyi CCMP1516]EOD35425.1 hypothetical protein EMIHUDRAFT_449214 [Emiliania huxleyi CCMP1516]|eukprot:XP_005787854.1 hypothetical protein EMIHUDRAFT_449214 [Emiliania huxleyi CCMP1516]
MRSGLLAILTAAALQGSASLRLQHAVQTVQTNLPPKLKGQICRHGGDRHTGGGARPPLRLRGGGGASATSASAAELARARLMLLVANAGFGSYSVLLRAVAAVPGAEPLGTLFITFVRYSFLCLFATATRSLRAVQARRRLADGGSASLAAPAPGASLAALELGTYSVSCALLSVWGTCRDHVFCPLVSLLLGVGGFGRRTWGACLLAFGAAALTAAVDYARGGGGEGGGGSLPGAVALVASAWAEMGGDTGGAGHDLLSPPPQTQALNLARMIGHVRPAQWALMGGGVFVSGFLSASLQFEAMRTISAAKSQPFAALQPLFAGLFGVALLREEVSLGTAVGGLLMIGAALVACGDEEAEEAAASDAAASAEAEAGEMLDEVVHPPEPRPDPRARRLRPTGAVAAVLAVRAMREVARVSRRKAA